MDGARRLRPRGRFGTLGGMNKPLSALSRLLVAGLALAGAGCMTNVSVTADEPGALIRYRGKGRPSYRWKTGGLVKKPGDTCSFRANYSAVDVYAIWDEGTPKMKKTETVTVPLSNWRDPDVVHLDLKR